VKFPNKYRELRKNASLEAVAKAAAQQARTAHREWREYYQALKERKGNTPNEYLSHLDALGRYLDECRELAKHLNRLAGTDFPIYLTETK
jgi:hypothetical protein